MKQSILREVHETADAVLRPETEASPLLTYGEVPTEYAAAREDCVLLDETDRGAVRVGGADARDFLHRLLSNEVTQLGEGRGNRQLLLSPKGKVLFDFALRNEGESGGFHLSLPPGDAPALCQALDMYHFTEEIELADETERHAPLLVLGPRAAERIESCLGIAPPTDPYGSVRGEQGGAPLTVTRLDAYGSPAFRLDAGPDRAEGLWSGLREAGVRPAGRIATDILRVESCVALIHEDVDDGVYPQEARLEEAFSLDKGCYIGQEVVAKIDTYGGLNKLLCALVVSHDDPLERGTRLYRLDEKRGEWRDLGMVTSWAYSFVSDTGRVLAYLKRKHTDPGIVFRVGEGPAEARVVE